MRLKPFSICIPLYHSASEGLCVCLSHVETQSSRKHRYFTKKPEGLRLHKSLGKNAEWKVFPLVLFESVEIEIIYGLVEYTDGDIYQLRTLNDLISPKLPLEFQVALLHVVMEELGAGVLLRGVETDEEAVDPNETGRGDENPSD